MMETKDNRSKSPWTFFTLTLALTWALWIPAGLVDHEQYGTLATILHYAGGVMPTLVALTLLFRTEDAEGWMDYARRLVDFRRIGLGWYAVIFLTVPLLTSFGLFLGGGGTSFDPLQNYLQSPLSLVPFALFMLLFGPLPEEMAWRGYALDRLQSQMNPFRSSLVLGLVWTVWHLPLFLIEGTYQHGLGIGSLPFWLYMLDKIPQSILMTWIYNSNKRSTLSAVLFHFMVNFSGEILDLTLQGEVVYIQLGGSWQPS